MPRLHCCLEIHVDDARMVAAADELELLQQRNPQAFVALRASVSDDLARLVHVESTVIDGRPTFVVQPSIALAAFLAAHRS